MPVHNCPDCGDACYCSGDFEDHDTGDEYMERCTHWQECRSGGDYDDDSDDWGDGGADPDPYEEDDEDDDRE